MFAGLPGIGVGTLFYICMSFWMPFRELPRVIEGTSSFNTWKLILRQMFYSTGIIITVMFAERVMLYVMGATQVKPFSPASWLHGELGQRAGNSIFAAPIMASVILLVGVLMTVEVMRIVMKRPERLRVEREPQHKIATAFEGALDSTTR